MLSSLLCILYLDSLSALGSHLTGIPPTNDISVASSQAAGAADPGAMHTLLRDAG
jgi:hypothetical protein